MIPLCSPSDCAVHPKDARDRKPQQFFEVPLMGINFPSPLALPRMARFESTAALRTWLRAGSAAFSIDPLLIAHRRA